MLVLSRKVDESLRIGEDVRVTVVSVSGGQVRLAVEAPSSVTIHREEVFERIAAANREAAQTAFAELELLENPEPARRATGGGEVRCARE